MAINTCSINSFTIDAGRCRDKFAALIPILHPRISSGTQGWVNKAAPTPRWVAPEAPRFDPVDSDLMTVTVEILGMTGSEKQRVEARQDLVTVTDIYVEPTELVVNIQNFKVTQDAEPNND